MKRDKIEANGLDTFIANISPMLDGLNTQMATMAQLLAACHDPIKDDAELEARMKLSLICVFSDRVPLLYLCKIPMLFPLYHCCYIMSLPAIIGLW